MRENSKPGILLWILTLAFLAVGARNFEPGLSIDGPLYASIARNLAHSSDWFHLDGNISTFEPFYEHPHLVFWIHGLLFKLLPAQDWAARIPSHLSYIFILFLFFGIVKKISSTRVATLTVLLLWSLGTYSNYFSNLYLDPINLLFGMAALYLALSPVLNGFRALLIGTCMGLALLSKGPTIVPYGLVVLLVLERRAIREKRISSLLLSAFSFALLLTFYFWGMSHSSEPQFFQHYRDRQYTHRFSQLWSLSSLFSYDYWKVLASDSNFIVLPFALCSLYRWRRFRGELLLPLALSLSCILFFAPIGRVGSQYSLYLLPPLAWLAALSLETWLPSTDRAWRRWSQFLALSALALIQYLPLKVHKRGPNALSIALSQLVEHGCIDQVWLDPKSPAKLQETGAGFVYAASIAWYGNIRVLYNSDDPVKIGPGRAWLSSRENEPQGWKKWKTFPDGNLMLPEGTRCQESM